MAELIEFAAGRGFIDAMLSAGMLSFLNDSWHMSNNKLLKELGTTLEYPDLDSGLAGSVGPRSDAGAGDERQ